jgi:hypothetical protein
LEARGDVLDSASFQLDNIDTSITEEK